MQSPANPTPFKTWKSLIQGAATPNHLWNTLEGIQQEEQAALHQAEAALRHKEKELQRQRKSAEANVKQQLSRRSLRAFWQPFLYGFARLHFSSAEIENAAAAKQYTKLLRGTLTSWQGLLAFFAMGGLIAFTTHPQWFADQAWFITLQTSFTQAWQSFRAWFTATLPPWLQISSATLVALIPIAKALGEYLLFVQTEQARIQSERDTLLAAAHQSVDALQREVAQLKLEVEEQRQRVGLTADYNSLVDFVNSRLEADTYGRHLGLMQMVRQDLASLSERLTPGPHNQAQLQKIFPRGPARVMLYIDDLDRCPPDRVIEVLEAVQLSLKTKLFIVIMAIDDRYIARALEQVYQGVLKRRGKPSGIDYLEKIIQIPYRMRPISPATVESYLRAQVHLTPAAAKPPTSPDTPAASPRPQSPDTATVPTPQPAGSPEAPTPQSVAPTAAPSPPSSPSPAAPAAPNPDAEPPTAAPASPDADAAGEAAPILTPAVTAATPADSASAAAQSSPSTPIAPPLETVAEVTALDAAEFEILVDCCQQVDITPRTAKRLINIYKILQIIWDTRQKQTPHPIPTPNHQQKRVVMAFLALSGRYPEFMRSLFEEIDVQLENTFRHPQQKDPLNPELYLTVTGILGTIQPPMSGNAYLEREWRRFDQDINRMLRDKDQAPDQDIELTLDRRTFELMLSFCFVGDLGYDPDDYHAELSQSSFTATNEQPSTRNGHSRNLDLPDDSVP